MLKPNAKMFAGIGTIVLILAGLGVLAKVAKAKQVLFEVTVLLGYTTVRAPRDGRIVDRNAEPGNTVQPGQP